MSAADSSNEAYYRIPPADRRLVRRMSVALVLLLALTFGVHRLYLLYSHKFFDVTGRADWIWPHHQISRNMPVAFFAMRDFDLPANRYFTKIKIAGDPEYTLYFNGREIGGRRVGDEAKLDVFDVSPLAKTGRNRIVVAVRSPNGVGGLLASVDIAPDFQNVVVTGSDWKISRSWTPTLLLRDPIGVESAAAIGEPPVGRWNYLDREAGAVEPVATKTVAPVSSFSFKSALPEIRDVAGTAVAGSRPIHATAFDFGGGVRGRLRLTITYDNGVSRVVKVRFANNREELYPLEGNVVPFVFAGGERVVLDEDVREFRYVLVYGSQATAEVVE
jgi:hypothetical protein